MKSQQDSSSEDNNYHTDVWTTVGAQTDPLPGPKVVLFCPKENPGLLGAVEPNSPVVALGVAVAAPNRPPVPAGIGVVEPFLPAW